MPWAWAGAIGTLTSPQAICLLIEQPRQKGLSSLDRDVAGLPWAIKVCLGTPAKHFLTWAY